MAPPRDRLRGLLQLVRPANVVTALADVLAGAAAALPLAPVDGLDVRSLSRLLLATGCLYAGGVVLNDFFDRDLDRVERPERPIPRGAVRPREAALVGGMLLVIGVAAAVDVNRTAAMIAFGLAALIVGYDAFAKRTPAGPLWMASCRGANLMLGVAIVPAAVPSRLPLGMLMAAYIGAVTVLSRGEVHGSRRSVAAICTLAMTVVVAALGWLALTARDVQYVVAGAVLTAALAIRVLPAFWRVYRLPEPMAIRRAVQTGILSLILFDAAVAATYGGPPYGLAVVVLILPAQLLARLFAVT
jgi:4-hydroxybenzoate polyprenyltransferase